MTQTTDNTLLELTALFHHLAACLDKQSDQMLMERLGIGFSQFRVMRELHEHPRTTQRIVAVELGQTEASISRQIKYLSEKALVSIERNPHDKREHAAQLTAKGARLYVEATRTLRYLYTSAFQSVDDKQHAVLHQILTATHQSVCVPGKLGSCQTHTQS